MAFREHKRSVRALSLALFLLLPGCAFLDQGAGDESLVMHNATSQPVSVILRIATNEGGVPIFSDEVPLDPGQTREFALAMEPGVYEVSMTTTNGLQERVPVEIPSHGDSRIEVTIQRSRASIAVTQ